MSNDSKPLVVVGEPGIGKTALLALAATQASKPHLKHCNTV